MVRISPPTANQPRIIVDRVPAPTAYAAMEGDYINPDPTPRQDDNSHTGIANEAADIFVVALVFYTLISAIFGASNLNNRGALLRDPQNVRWWHYVGLFMLGWAWPLFCCFICRDICVERCSRRERRRRREQRRRERELRESRERQEEEEVQQPDLESGGQGATRDPPQVDGEDGSPGLWRKLLRGLPFWGKRHGGGDEVIEAQELEDITPTVSKSRNEIRACENAGAGAAPADSESRGVNQPSNPGPSGSDEVQVPGTPNSTSRVKDKGKGKQVGWVDLKGKGVER